MGVNLQSKEIEGFDEIQVRNINLVPEVNFMN